MIFGLPTLDLNPLLRTLFRCSDRGGRTATATGEYGTSWNYSIFYSSIPGYRTHQPA